MSELTQFLVLNIPLATFSVMAMHFTLTPRKNKLLTFLVVEIPFVLIAMMKQLVPDMNYIVSSFSAWAYLIICGAFLYSESIKTKIFNIAVNIGINYVLSLVIGCIFMPLGFEMGNLSVSFIFLNYAVYGAAYFVFFNLRKKRLSNIANNRYTVIGISLAVVIEIIVGNFIEIIRLIRNAECHSVS